jgi:flagellar assembly protein FliH
MTDWRPLSEILASVEEPAVNAALEPHTETPPSEPLYTQAPASHRAMGRVQAPAQNTASSEASPEGQELETQRRAAYQEGMAQARQESDALALRYRDAIESLCRAREQVVKQSEQELVQLSLIIAREVLMADVVGREQFTQRMVEHALSLLGDAQTTTFRIAPQDLQVLRQHKPELMRRPGLTWQEDPAIALGGVVVETDRGRMDASISHRLELMARTLLGEAKDAAAAP